MAARDAAITVTFKVFLKGPSLLWRVSQGSLARTDSGFEVRVTGKSFFKEDPDHLLAMPPLQKLDQRKAWLRMRRGAGKLVASPQIIPEGGEGIRSHLQDQAVKDI